MIELERDVNAELTAEAATDDLPTDSLDARRDQERLNTLVDAAVHLRGGLPLRSGCSLRAVTQGRSTSWALPRTAIRTVCPSCEEAGACVCISRVCPLSSCRVYSVDRPPNSRLIT